MERPVGIEPTWSAWKAEARPLGEGRQKPSLKRAEFDVSNCNPPVGFLGATRFP